MVHLNLKKYQEAVKFFNQSLVHDKKLISVYYYLGECYKNINNVDKALSYYILSHHQKAYSKILECYLIYYMKCKELLNENRIDKENFLSINKTKFIRKYC